METRLALSIFSLGVAIGSFLFAVLGARRAFIVSWFSFTLSAAVLLFILIDRRRNGRR